MTKHDILFVLTYIPAFMLGIAAGVGIDGWLA